MNPQDKEPYDLHIIAKNLNHNERIALFEYIRITKEESRNDILKEVEKMIDESKKKHEGLCLATKFDYNVSITHQNFCVELNEFKTKLQELKEK